MDGDWLLENVLSGMFPNDTFQVHAETTAGTADLLVTNKYVGYSLVASR